MKTQTKAITIICIGIAGIFVPLVPAIILIPMGLKMLFENSKEDLNKEKD